jgi:4-hydroxythreonine-4-phosphate dehydrogenase
VPVCDGEDERDLDAVVDALSSLPADLASVALAGSAGLAAAVGRARADAAGPSPSPSPSPELVPPRGLLVVVGTAEPTAAAQVTRLLDAGACEVRIPVPTLLAPEAEGRADALVAAVATGVSARGVVVVRPDPEAAVDVSSSRRISTGLGSIVARSLARSPGSVGLALTGGETARRVLDALGVVSLTPIGQVHHGAVVSRASDGRTVVTRPGSFGDPQSLCAIVSALRRPGADGFHPDVTPGPERSPSKLHERQ